MAVTGALLGATMGAGLLLVVSGRRGVENRTPPTPNGPTVVWPIDGRILVRRAAVAVMACAAVWASTGWPMAGATAVGMSIVVPMLTDAQRMRERRLEQAEDLARWCEMVRDAMRGGAGLKAAIDTTARPRVTGSTIRFQVRSLSDRCDAMSIPQALRQFADDVADPICDQIVASLIMVEERGGRELAPVLTEIVSSVRRRAAMRRRVEVGRVRTYSAQKAMVVMTMGLALGMAVFAESFMEPFDTAAGQFWMFVVGATFTGGVWAIIPMSRPEDEARLLGPVADGAHT